MTLYNAAQSNLADSCQDSYQAALAAKQQKLYEAYRVAVLAALRKFGNNQVTYLYGENQLEGENEQQTDSQTLSGSQQQQQPPKLQHQQQVGEETQSAKPVSEVDEEDAQVVAFLEELDKQGLLTDAPSDSGQDEGNSTQQLQNSQPAEDQQSEEQSPQQQQQQQEEEQQKEFGELLDNDSCADNEAASNEEQKKDISLVRGDQGLDSEQIQNSQPNATDNYNQVSVVEAPQLNDDKEQEGQDQEPSSNQAQIIEETNDKSVVQCKELLTHIRGKAGVMLETMPAVVQQYIEIQCLLEAYKSVNQEESADFSTYFRQKIKQIELDLPQAVQEVELLLSGLPNNTVQTNENDQQQQEQAQPQSAQTQQSQQQQTVVKSTDQIDSAQKPTEINNHTEVASVLLALGYQDDIDDNESEEGEIKDKTQDNDQIVNQKVQEQEDIAPDDKKQTEDQQIHQENENIQKQPAEKRPSRFDIKGSQHENGKLDQSQQQEDSNNDDWQQTQVKKRKLEEAESEPEQTSKTQPTVKKTKIDKKVQQMFQRWDNVKKSIIQKDKKPSAEATSQEKAEQWRLSQLRSGKSDGNANFTPLNPVRKVQAPDLEALSAELPIGWRAMWDANSERVYYGNLSTREVSWYPPS
eukprot:TRINITY_DN8780_c0_g1_i1.p1 TRINITY_DN8780_c0_g1~~TRINITY_DN8780_c0_g1_i1.p1  ORF type:complete len:636 (-),score=116.57 TRINITY_DN8780_c0_g1_i1:399-2306(-)